MRVLARISTPDRSLIIPPSSSSSSSQKRLYYKWRCFETLELDDFLPANTRITDLLSEEDVLALLAPDIETALGGAITMRNALMVRRAREMYKHTRTRRRIRRFKRYLLAHGFSRFFTRAELDVVAEDYLRFLAVLLAVIELAEQALAPDEIVHLVWSYDVLNISRYAFNCMVRSGRVPRGASKYINESELLFHVALHTVCRGVYETAFGSIHSHPLRAFLWEGIHASENDSDDDATKAFLVYAVGDKGNVPVYCTIRDTVWELRRRVACMANAKTERCILFLPGIPKNCSLLAAGIGHCTCVLYYILK